DRIDADLHGHRGPNARLVEPELHLRADPLGAACREHNAHALVLLVRVRFGHGLDAGNHGPAFEVRAVFGRYLWFTRRRATAAIQAEEESDFVDITRRGRITELHEAIGRDQIPARAPADAVEFAVVRVEQALSLCDRCLGFEAQDGSVHCDATVTDVVEPRTV